jgi:hypothetical protein
MTGAGGMIGYLVYSYQMLDGEDGPRAAFFDTLQAAVDDDTLTIEAARRLFDAPPLAPEEFDALIAGEEYAGIGHADGVVSCDPDATCNASDIAFLQAELDALNYLAENEGAGGDYYGALEAAAEADGIVLPNRSPDDDDVRRTMLEEVKDLLDIDQTDYVFEEPMVDEGEAGPDDET